MFRRCFALVAILFVAIAASEKLKLCATIDEIEERSCQAVQKGDSPVKCQRVMDSAECAISLAEGNADFGLFAADELLLAQHFYPTGLQVVAQLKHNDKIADDFEFQSVVIVPKSYNAVNDSFEGLRGAGLCHPGFSKSQTWTDRALKYFERKVMSTQPPNCQSDVTSAEREIMNLNNFFGRSCRPGEWVSDKNFDDHLKSKYQKMCELCENFATCSHPSDNEHGHQGALDCLGDNRGKVAIASLRYVQEYLKQNPRMLEYQLLCENGSVMPIHSTNPCVWYKQPWPVVVSREASTSGVKDILEQVKTNETEWKATFRKMLFEKNSYTFLDDKIVTPAEYLSAGMGTELPKSECGDEIRWCTVNEREMAKCHWTAAAGLVAGIEPAITCVADRSNFGCFDKISRNEADVIVIDSNYGYLARKAYNLTAVVYCDSNEDNYSFVVGAVKEHSSRRIGNFDDLKGSDVCFPEYSGIAWISFLNAARERGILSNSCKYASIVANLVNRACAPGYAEASHFAQQIKPRVDDHVKKTLCELCPMQTNGETCEAKPENDFFGDRGALECLKRGGGNFAILEARNIKAYLNSNKDNNANNNNNNNSIDANDYRVLCKNGTLASRTGFDVDEGCALSVTIDAEIVARREDKGPKFNETKFTVLKINDYFGYSGRMVRSLRIYGPFNGTENLLFKDTTSAVYSTDEKIRSILAYKELFEHVDKCSGATMHAVATIALVIANFVLARFM